MVLLHSSSLSASVNPNGTSCPNALKLVACVLLLEVTTFLRETYRNLPRASRCFFGQKPDQKTTSHLLVSDIPNSRSQQAHLSGTLGNSLLSAMGGSTTPVSGVLSTTMATNPATGRRWSMAAQSIGSVTGASIQLPVSHTAALTPTELSAMSPSTSAMPALVSMNNYVPSHEHRRISFVIQDDNESVTSSQTTLAMQVSMQILFIFFFSIPLIVEPKKGNYVFCTLK